MADLDGLATDPARIDPAGSSSGCGRSIRCARAAGDGAIEVVRAPGRVNLIGEHTDYNDGFVMPAAIGLELRLAVLPTDDRRVDRHPRRHRRDGVVRPRRDRAADPDLDRLRRGHGVGARRGRPAVARVPRPPGLDRAAGRRAVVVGGARDGVGTGAARAGCSTVPAARRATLGQRAENGYVGVQSGVMDQFASAAGVAGQAILLDCRSLDVRHVPLPRGPPARRLPQRLVAQARDVGVQPAPGGVRPGGGGDPPPGPDRSRRCAT